MASTTRREIDGKVWPGGRCTRDFPPLFKFDDILLIPHPNTKLMITTQVCTRYDNTASVSGTNICSVPSTANWMTTNGISHQILITMKMPLVQCTLDTGDRSNVTTTVGHPTNPSVGWNGMGPVECGQNGGRNYDGQEIRITLDWM